MIILVYFLIEKKLKEYDPPKKETLGNLIIIDFSLVSQNSPIQTSSKLKNLFFFVIMTYIEVLFSS